MSWSRRICGRPGCRASGPMTRPARSETSLQERRGGESGRSCCVGWGSTPRRGGRSIRLRSCTEPGALGVTLARRACPPGQVARHRPTPRAAVVRAQPPEPAREAGVLAAVAGASAASHDRPVGGHPLDPRRPQDRCRSAPPRRAGHHERRQPGAQRHPSRPAADPAASAAARPSAGIAAQGARDQRSRPGTPGSR
jgi:hypothetical protein